MLLILTHRYRATNLRGTPDAHYVLRIHQVHRVNALLSSLTAARTSQCSRINNQVLDETIACDAVYKTDSRLTLRLSGRGIEARLVHVTWMMAHARGVLTAETIAFDLSPPLISTASPAVRPWRRNTSVTFSHLLIDTRWHTTRKQGANNIMQLNCIALWHQV